MELAKKIVAACEKPSNFQLLYPDEASIKEKIETVARKIYGAAKVKYLPAAEKAIAEFEALDPAYARFPVCMAKRNILSRTTPPNWAAPPATR